ncbi:hypothetical protein GOV09_01305 [Candidatus Woesearchaeota archaeon]|nr:hypothetical protein [Candidatus Woesearchaeota archaeon]
MVFMVTYRLESMATSVDMPVHYHERAQRAVDLAGQGWMVPQEPMLRNNSDFLNSALQYCMEHDLDTKALLGDLLYLKACETIASTFMGDIGAGGHGSILTGDRRTAVEVSGLVSRTLQEFKARQP